MAIENTREVTGISSIPAYEVKTGLFTQNAVKSNVLDFQGTTETPEDVFGSNYKQNTNLYVFSNQANEVRKVKGVTQTNGLGTMTVILEEAFSTNLTNEFPKIIAANLRGYSIVNEGDKDGEFDGKSIAPTVSINNEYSPQTPTKPAVFINATYTTFLIREYR